MHMHVAGVSVLDPRPGRSALLRRCAAGRRSATAPRAPPAAAGAPCAGRFRTAALGRRRAFRPRFPPAAFGDARRPEGGSSWNERWDASSHVPSTRPSRLWELYVFEGLAHQRTAVLLKMHHALADGISGMLIASALFDLSPDTGLGTPPKTPWVPEHPPSRQDLVRDAVQDMVLHPLEAIGQAVGAPQRTLADVAPDLGWCPRRDRHGLAARRAVRHRDRAGPPVRHRRDPVRTAPGGQERARRHDQRRRAQPRSRADCTSSSMRAVNPRRAERFA